ncbi:MAG: hypothetical protein ACK4HQ_04935, partial [Brevinematales bacterium]
MKPMFWCMLFVVLGTFSCGMKKVDVYYPKMHYTPMTLDQADKRVIYLEWGNSLVYAGKMQTNTEVVKGKTN